MPHMDYRLRNIEFLRHKPCSIIYLAGGAPVEKLSVKRISSFHLEWLANSAEMANDKERGYKRTIKTNCTLKSELYFLPLILMCFVHVLSQWVYRFVTGTGESFSETIGQLANLLPLSVFHSDDALRISLSMGLKMLPNISEVAFTEKFSIV